MGYPDELSLNDFRSGSTTRYQLITRADLPDLCGLPLGESETIVIGWNDGRDPTLHVVVAADWSNASLLLNGHWYGAVRTDGQGSDDERMDLVVGRNDYSWRTSEILPRGDALAILQALPDLDRVRREHRWLSELRHDPGHGAPDINL